MPFHSLPAVEREGQGQPVLDEHVEIGGADGIGFAIPINRVKSVVREILDHGKIRARRVDFQTTSLNERIGQMLGSDAERGAVVTEVQASGPATDAGIKVGDVIVSVNGEKVQDAQDLRLKVWYNRQVGARCQFVIDRGGTRVETQYVVAEPED